MTRTVKDPDQEWVKRQPKPPRHWPWLQRIVDWLWRVKP